MAHKIEDGVKETSVSTGTTTVSLAGAMTGFVPFSAKCAVGDTVFCGMRAVDAGGSPTGEWEIGLYTYSSANTLTRTTPLSGSAALPVNFSAGTKQVYLTQPAAQVAWARERLTAARTYYVATTGSDTASGLAVGTPFLTIQKAIDVAATLDSSIYNVTIQVADGTYTGTYICKTMAGSGSIMITGNTTTPANCVLTASSGIIVDSRSVATVYIISGVNFTATGTTSRAIFSLASEVQFSNVEFGSGFVDYHLSTNTGGRIKAVGPYTISGGTAVHASSQYGGWIWLASVTCTITGTPAFSSSFASAEAIGIVSAQGATFSGTATGKRYAAVTNGLVNTGGQATTWLPGNVAGTTASGGQYS